MLEMITAYASAGDMTTVITIAWAPAQNAQNMASHRPVSCKVSMVYWLSCWSSPRSASPAVVVEKSTARQDSARKGTLNPTLETVKRESGMVSVPFSTLGWQVKSCTWTGG